MKKPEKIGRYQVIGELGRGGMATVYQAKDPNIDRYVAIKVLPREFLHDPQFRERFEREARTVAGLEHQAIVPVYDYGEEDGQLYLVMRYMPGGSLEEKITRYGISLEETAKIVTEISEALDEAHLQGVIHRDLKPGNILFDQYGKAHLSDFGIAKIIEAGGALTGTGIIGTPAYMSPEQARGEKDIDGRSDIYALGVIVFEMLTGRAPYESDTPMGVAVKHILDPIPPILEVNKRLPEDIAGVMERVMAKGRESRYLTAAEFSAALNAVAAGEALPELPRRPIRGGTPTPVLPATPPSAAATAPTMTAAEEAALTQRAVGAAVSTQAAHDTGQTAAPIVVEKRVRGGFFRPMLISCAILLGFPLLLCAIIQPARIVGEITDALPQGMEMPGFFTGFMGESVELSGETSSQGFSFARDDTITQLEVRLTLGSVETNLGLLDADSTLLAEAIYEGDTGLGDLQADYEVVGSSKGRLTIEQQTVAMSEEGMKAATLDLNLPADIPIDLYVDIKFADTYLDLSGLNVQSLTFTGGGGKAQIKLPTHSENLLLDVSGGAGDIIIQSPDDTSQLTISKLIIEGGLGAVNLELPAVGPYDVILKMGLGNGFIRVPDGLEAQIILHTDSGRLTMLNDLFSEIDDHTWQTEGYPDSDEGVLIDVTLGAGSITVQD